MDRDTVRQIAVWVGVVATIVVNALANALPINNQATGDIANQFKGQNYWLPAGYVFAIWGLIYLGLMAYAVYQSLPSQRENPRLRLIGWPFVVSCVANIVWLLLFHYNQFVLSMVAMVVILAALIVIYLSLGIGRSAVTPGERWTVRLTFSIYLGWITVATVANAAHVLVSLGWTGGFLGSLPWLILMFLVALALAAAMAVQRRDLAYQLVLLWAFIGIAVNYSNVTGVVISAVLAAVAVGVIAVLTGGRALWQGKTYA
jgi:hypothetical protein